MMDNKKSVIINTIAIVLLFIILILLKRYVLSDYIQGILMSAFIAIIMATSLNIATGFLGQIALGHAGFMAIGAYTSAIITVTMRNSHILVGSPVNDLLRFGIGTVCGGIFAAVCGILVGIPALRLKGDYLGIITLGFGEIIRVIIQNLDITKRGRSYVGIDGLSNLYVVFWIMIFTVAILVTFINSKYGRAIMAIREDEIAAGASGLNTTYYKVLAFTVSALFAGIAGSIYAHYISTLQPGAFNFNKSIDYIVIVVLGGMGSITGSVIAALILIILPEVFRAFSEYRMLVYSVALIVVMVFKPSGIFGGYEFSLSRFLGKYFGKNKKNTQTTVDGGEA